MKDRTQRLGVNTEDRERVKDGTQMVGVREVERE